MIGAHKLKEQQVQEIKRLFATTMLCDGDIADMYGVSRELINMIRSGRRWNDEKNSFVMKDKIRQYTKTITQVWGKTFASQITPVETAVGRRFIVIHYLDNEVYPLVASVLPKEPTYEELRERHDVFVKLFEKKSVE